METSAEGDQSVDASSGEDNEFDDEAAEDDDDFDEDLRLAFAAASEAADDDLPGLAEL